MDIKLLKEVERFCEQHYNETTLEHAHRVANYAIESPILYAARLAIRDIEDIVYIVALLHDIIEDNYDSKVQKQAECFISSVVDSVGDSIYMFIDSKVLERLTKKTSENYIDYIKRLRTLRDSSETDTIDLIVAYIVKLADMKDHLMQKDTLTDKLKEKYWNALPYLL